MLHFPAYFRQNMLPNLFQRNMLFNMLLLSCLIDSEETNCTGHQCCDGYEWNPDSKTCEKCETGYIGPNCTHTCPYPAYGDGCRGNCNCSENECDFSTGCKPHTTGVKQETTVIGGYTKKAEQNTTERITVIKYGYTTSANISSSDSDSKNLNTILLNLIEIFGLVDIILICMHLALFINDQRSKRALEHNQTEDNEERLYGSNVMYENVEVVIV